MPKVYSTFLLYIVYFLVLRGPNRAPDLHHPFLHSGRVVRIASSSIGSVAKGQGSSATLYCFWSGASIHQRCAKNLDQIPFDETSVDVGEDTPRRAIVHAMIGSVNECFRIFWLNAHYLAAQHVVKQPPACETLRCMDTNFP